MRSVILITLLFIILPLYSQSVKSIDEMLKDGKYSFTKDEEGDYIVSYLTDSGRIQDVIIRNNINNFNNVYIREVISVAQKFEKRPIPENLTNYLLIDNYSTKYLGNWAIHKKEDISTILFIVKLPEITDAMYLYAAITETGEAADALQSALYDEMNN